MVGSYVGYIDISTNICVTVVSALEGVMWG